MFAANFFSSLAIKHKHFSYSFIILVTDNSWNRETHKGQSILVIWNIKQTVLPSGFTIKRFLKALMTNHETRQENDVTKYNGVDIPVFSWYRCKGTGTRIA